MNGRTRTATLVAAAIVGLVYCAVLAALPRHVFWSPDEGVKFIQMQAVHWSDGLAYSLPYPRERLDRELASRASHCEEQGFYPSLGEDGRLRFHWPMWFPLLSRPFFDALGIAGIYVVPLLSGLFTALLAGWLCARFDPKVAPAAVLLVGLGTPVFFYALCFWEHTLASLLGLAAIAIVTSARPANTFALLAAAPILTAAALLRIEMVGVAAACVLTWVSCRLASGRRGAAALGTTEELSPGPATWRSWAPPLLSLTALAVLLLSLPGAFAPRHGRVLAALPRVLAAALQRLPAAAVDLVSAFVNGPTGDGPSLDRLSEAAAFLAAGICLIAPLYRPHRAESLVLFPAMLALLVFSAAVLLSQQTIHALHGVIPPAPYIVVAGYTCQAAWRRRDYRLWGLAIAALSYMVIAFLLVFVRGPVALSGLEWGPRYFLTLYPMMAVLALLALRLVPWKGRRRLAFAGMLVAMMLVAVGWEVRGLAMLYQRRSEIAAWDGVLRDRSTIVTDAWWLPAALAPIFVSREMYCLGNRDELAEWLAAAPPHATAVTFASPAPIESGTLPLAGGGRAFVHSPERVAGLYFARIEPARGSGP